MCCVYKIQCSPVEEPSEHRVVGIGMRAIYLVLTLRSQGILGHPRSKFSAHLVNIYEVTSEERRVI